MSRLRLRHVMPALGAVVVAGTAGCAFDPGDPYGVVEATLDAHYEPLTDRSTPDGFERLHTDFQVRLTSAKLTVDTVELIDSAAGGVIPAFDPANPPPGYGSCHGGHCHADDGSLVSYEAIAAELVAAGGSLTTVVTMSPGTLDLLDPTSVALHCEPSCALPEGYVALTRLTASRLQLRGQVRDSLALPRIDGVASWRADVSLLEHMEHADDDGNVHADDDGHEVPGVFELRLDLPIDDDQPPNISLVVRLRPDATLLDHVDFEGVAPDGEGLIDLDGPDGSDAQAEIAHGLSEMHIAAVTTRSGE